MYFYPFSGEVEHRTYLYLRLCNANSPFHVPKVVVGRIHLSNRHVSVGKVSFQAVPAFVLLYFGSVNVHFHTPVHPENLVVSVPVDVVLCQRAPFICLLKSADAFFTAIGILPRTLGVPPQTNPGTDGDETPLWLSIPCPLW